jgi:carbon monoxide dehydrogenase subunit G
MKVERTIELPAEPQAVYELVMDPRRLEDWVTIHAGLKDAPNGELRKGSELTQSLKIAHRRFNVRWTVVEDDCPSRVVWEGRGPAGSRAKVVYDLEPANGNGTRFCYSNEYSMPGGPLGRLASRALKGTSERESERSLKRLKALLTG